MSQILDALVKIDTALDSLETACAAQEQKMRAANQQDLFNGGKSSNGHTGPVQGQLNVDPDLIVRKLDTTIERMEQVLREG